MHSKCKKKLLLCDKLIILRAKSNICIKLKRENVIEEDAKAFKTVALRNGIKVIKLISLNRRWGRER